MEAILNFDLAIFEFIEKFVWAQWLDPVMKAITWFGNGEFWIIVGVVLLFFKKTRKIGIAMLLAQLIMLIGNNLILKNLISRTRPFLLFNPNFQAKCDWIDHAELTRLFDETRKFSPEFVAKWLETFEFPEWIGHHIPKSYSFPSGHTASSFAAACGAFSMCKGKLQKTFGILAIILAALIGFTRIYLHVHYCTDVLGGIVVGVLCAVAGYFLCKLIYPHLEKLGQKIKAKRHKKAE